MVAVLREEPHFEVPARASDPDRFTDGNTARLMLAGRIAALPAILTIDNGSEPVPSSVTVYLVNEHGPMRKRRPPITLCVLNRDGMTVNGLSLRDRRHLAERGWGILHHDRVQVPHPRNAGEVEVCWTILQHAHSSLLNISISLPASHHALHGDLPRFSRTTLQ
jgi:hypothetical protein